MLELLLSSSSRQTTRAASETLLPPLRLSLLLN
jgi:hypothetical protein